MISMAYIPSTTILILPKLVSLNFFLNCERERIERSKNLPACDLVIYFSAKYTFIAEIQLWTFLKIQSFYYKTNVVTFVFIFFYQLFGIQSQLTFCETAASIFTCFFFMSINPVLIILGKSWHHKKCRQQQRRRWGEGDTWCSQDTVRPRFSYSFV